MPANYDCTRCGLCCHANWEVDVAESDTVPEHLTRLDPILNTFPVMRMRKGMCVAFRRRGGRTLCSIYENRPTVCREFQPGCLDCQQLRREAGMEV